MSRFVNPFQQHGNDALDPLPKGKLFFFRSGTNSDLDTFADINESVLNTNPVILSASGREPPIFYTGSAKVILTDSDDVQIGVRDPVESGAAGGNFAAWNDLSIYSSGIIVTGDDSLYYVSLTEANQGNEPSVSPANWTQVLFTRVYNALETYVIGSIVRASDNLLYVSLTASNIGNDPVTDDINWQPATAIDVPDAVLAAGFDYAYNTF